MPKLRLHVTYQHGRMQEILFPKYSWKHLGVVLLDYGGLKPVTLPNLHHLRQRRSGNFLL